MKIVSVSNQKGGCGKTTTAINLAGALANLGRRVLVIDLDPQSHATFGLGISSQAIDKSIYNVMTDNPEKRRTISDCILNVSENLDLIPSNILLSTLEQELKDKEDAVSKLHNILSENSLDYNYIIIDCPPSLGFLTFNSLRAAELILVPIDMSAFSLMGVGKLLGMLELIKVKINHAPAVKALATIFDKRTKYSQTMLDEIKGFFKDQMLETVIRTSVSLKKAAFSGVPVVRLDPKANGALDHTALAREIMKTEGEAEFEKAMAEASAEDVDAIKVVPRTEVIFRKLSSNEPEKAPVGVLAEPARETALGSVQKLNEIPQAMATSPVNPIREATFSINMPVAKEIYVVGDFNNWTPESSYRLTLSDDGRWETRLSLAPGKYKYKFVVDGQWVTDPNNAEKEQNQYGTFNSIIDL